MKKYTGKYFKQGLPEWKRIKDPITSRIFYRPVSFYVAAFCANRNISANAVSYFSILIAVAACSLMLIPNIVCNISGAVLVNLWLISDCTDGNLARSVRKQPFGVFADSASSYILVAFLCTAMGMASYFSGGILVKAENVWIVLLGALASSGDTLMRLIYQKYKATERELQDRGLLKVSYDQRTDENQTNSILVRVESDFGIGGILPLLVLLGTIFHFLDVVVIYCFIYYFGSSFVMILKYVYMAIKQTSRIEKTN